MPLILYSKLVTNHYFLCFKMSSSNRCKKIAGTFAASFDPSTAVVDVMLPQTPEDDFQKRDSCVWKADKLITVG